MSKLAEQLKSEVVNLESENGKNHEIADQILREVLASNRPARFDEKTFCRAKLGWDDDEFGRQLNRMRNVVRNEAIVGSAKGRSDAEVEREKANELLSSEGPKILAKIEQLKIEHSKLESTALRAAKRCEEILAGMAELRTSLRTDIGESYSQKLASVRQEFSQIGELNVDIAFRENLLGSIPEDYNAHQTMLATIRNSYPDCIRYSEHKRGLLEFVEPNWSERKKTLAKELAEMTKKRDELVKVRDAQLVEVEALCDFYVGK